MFMPFNEGEYRERLQAVRRTFAAQGLDAILVTLPDSLHWLTGYDTIGYLWTQALVIGADGEPRFITRTSEEPGFNETSILSEARFYDIATEDVVDVSPTRCASWASPTRGSASSCGRSRSCRASGIACASVCPTPIGVTRRGSSPRHEW